MKRLVTLVVLTLLWPALHLHVFWLRFGRMPPEGASHALVFLPMGLVAALGALGFWMRAKSPRQRRGVATHLNHASKHLDIAMLCGAHSVNENNSANR